MDFLLSLFSGALNCVILIMAVNANSSKTYDSGYWIGLGLAFVAGYGLSLVRDVRKMNFSGKTSLIKFFASLFLCYLAWMGKDSYPGWLEWVIAGVSFGSLYVVDGLEKMFSMGIPKLAQLLLNNLSSYIDKNKTREEDNL